MTKQLEVTAEIIFHATEDSRKIFEPIFELFQIKEDEFSQERILGHYGNPILLAKTTLIKKRAEDFVKNLVSRVSKSQMNDLLDNIEMYFEDSTMFLRVSKNDLVRGIISLQQNNAIKIKIKIPIYKKDELTKTYMELLKV
ncbi:MAG: hypothetical protein E6K91_03870 [Thaumarchaeota archaeon]|nr:MAG: hypothetical protein E6K91_03870 [Nitrososphaerota archaeon]